MERQEFFDLISKLQDIYNVSNIEIKIKKKSFYACLYAKNLDKKHNTNKNKILNILKKHSLYFKISETNKDEIIFSLKEDSLSFEIKIKKYILTATDYLYSLKL